MENLNGTEMRKTGRHKLTGVIVVGLSEQNQDATSTTVAATAALRLLPDLINRGCVWGCPAGEVDRPEIRPITSAVSCLLDG
ncbi:hypothetical protein HanPSC8_Chr13g0563111 [Helianthus annuus]|nr:hypothetical protein HanPSC8_Chr13g0563111 [Helianthus annuus]